MINPIHARPGRGRGLRPQARHAVALLPGLLALGLLVVWPVVRANAQGFTFVTVSPKAVGVSSNLSFTLSVSPVPPNGVFFGHGGSAPANSFPTNGFLDSISGAFAWTPNQSQVGANSITVWAFDRSNLLNSNFTTFNVLVTNAVPPGSDIVIDTIPPQTVTEGATLIFTNSAHATRNTNNALAFSLIDAPAGATMTSNSPTSAVFSWTPTSAQAQTPLYTIREVVAEVGTSSTNFQDFQVTVTRTNNCAQLAAFLAAVQQGGYFLLTNCTTIVLPNALTIANSVTLDAGTNQVTISGGGQSRLFTVVSGVTNFTLRGLTLSGGRDPVGGAIYISPGANVMLTNCTLAGNGAVGNSGTAGKDAGNGSTGGNGGNGTSGLQAVGGAIYNLGGLTIWNSSFLTNNATGGSGGSGGKGGNGSIQGGNGGNGGAGALGYGGAIYNLGTLVLTNCTLSGNTATGGSAGSGGAAGIGPWAGDAGRGAAGASGNGAAIYSVQSLTAVNCTFSGNAAQSGNSTAGGTDTGSGNGLNGPRGPDSLGGGVYHQGGGTFNNCTFANNTVTAGSGGNGGDLYPIGIHTPGNGGDGGNGIGGGIYNTGTVAVLNCTFASCGATGGTNGVGGGVSLRGKDGAPGHGRGGDIAQGSGAFLLQNSILGASSSGTNAYDTTASRITDVGFNISSDSSLNLSGTSLKSTDPLLGTLASNGGPTQTISLQPGSPALNRIPPSLSPPTDQRGVSRPQGPASDVGAFELATLPAILAQPQSQTNAAGSAVTFAVSAVGDPLGYQWRFNTNAITNATSNSYTIGSVASSNGGSYDVVITNGFGSVTSSPAILTVIFPPVITLQPTNLTVTAGSNAAFAAQASSVVSLAYQWKFNGTNIQATAGTSAAGLAALGLTITNAQAADAGSYTVVVSNVYGAVTSSAATLTVNALPTNSSLTVSGRIVQGGVGLSGVTVLAGTNSTVTGADGYYTNLNLSLGTNVLVAPSLGGYAFAPAAQSVVVLSNTTLPDFSAFPSLAVVPSGSGVFQLAFAPGFTCQIQASSNMVNWQTFYATNNLSTNTLLLRFTDTNYATLPARFYRLGQTLVGQPVLTNCFASNQIMSVCGVAAPIVACRIEASTNLKSWTTVFTTNLPAPAAFQFEHAEVVAPPVRFYRLSQTPGF